MALLVARRLGLMRDHWAALKPDDTPLSADAYRRTLGGMLDTRIGQAEARERVVECGIFLLGLEVSAMLWLVGGWSSLVALRFRCFVLCFRCIIFFHQVMCTKGALISA